MLIIPVNSFAEVPVPARKMSLEKIQKNLEDERQRQKSLEGQLDNLKAELEQTRSSLVSIAAEIRDVEASLNKLEKRIDANAAEEKTLTEKLEADYGSIADLILALERMRRIPPESLIVRPGAPLETAQTAMLLQSTLPAVNRRTDRLSEDLRRLNQLTKTLESDRASVVEQKKTLDAKHASMKTLVEKRQVLYRETESDYADNKKAVARLSREAQTLMDLITRLDEETAKRQVTGKATRAVMPAPGQSRLPVTGYVIEAFGQNTAIGSKSLGVTIESQPGSLAVAPMGGVVRFTGTFKNYGNMIIIEHKNGYHSLISGLQQINAQVESTVKAGEPVGQLPLSSSRGGRPALYYELRLNGQPVDPASMFSELKI